VRLIATPTGHEMALLLLCVLATLAGSRFTLWRRGRAGSIASAGILIGISGALALAGEHPLGVHAPLSQNLAFALGLAAGLAFPCCAQNQSRAGAVQALGVVAVLAHCLLDGHVIREAGPGWITLLLVAHKFQDGADVRLFGSGSPSGQPWMRIAVIVATPLGFLLIPHGRAAEALHVPLLALIIGLNIGNALHLARHAAAWRREAPDCAAC
jgi:hypothetical protein